MNRPGLPDLRLPPLAGGPRVHAPAARSRPAPVSPRLRLRARSGFSLLETLIALLILSVGALGSVALQLQALQATHSAYQRTLASLIAADAGERLWMASAGGGAGLGWLADWVQRRDCGQPGAHVCLPELEVRVNGSGTGRVISVSWAEARFADAADGRVQLEYVVEIPQGSAS